MKTTFLAFLTLCALTLSGCFMGHPDPYVTQGRIGGAAAGALAGGILGNNINGLSSWEGAAAGAILGGLLGDSAGKANSAYYNSYRRPYYGGYYY